MKLFGLIEQMNIYSIFPLESIVPSHSDLFKTLEKYENNSLSVGLQLDSTEKVLKIPPLEFHRQEIFLELFKYFNKNSKKIHFLESREHFESLAEIARKASKIQKQLKKSKNNKKELELESYKLGVEFKYIQAIGINDVILKNISLYKPDLVFIGEGHANWFYLNKKEIRKKYDIQIEEYYRDKVIKQPTQDDLMFAAGASDKHLRMEDILKDKLEIITEKINPNQRLEPELQTLLIQRNYNAVKKGRIINKNPHFIGTWDLEIEPRGLFELYIEKASLKEKDGSFPIEFVGKIEDCLGSATAEGDLYPDYITFTKKYYKHLEGSEQPVRYEGKFNLSDGEVSGEYQILHSSNGSNKFGSFKMEQLREIDDISSLILPRSKSRPLPF